MAPSTLDSANTPAEPKIHKSGDPSLALPSNVPTGPPSFDDPYAERAYLKQRLAMALRIFAKCGFAEGVAGHITVRDPVDKQSFWVNPFGLHFSLITADDLILVDHKGIVIDGGKNRFLNYAAFAIHSEIHAARPDIICAAHSHSVYGRAFCATGRELDMITQDSCVFYNDHVLYPQFAGVVLASSEGKEIAAALGSKFSALLGSHGLLTTGRSIEEAVAKFVLLDQCCQVQLAAEQSGRSLVKIGEQEAKVTWEALGTSATGYFMGLPLFQTVEEEFGPRTLLGRGVESI